ncbi:helix-turn-helix domain-containing protein [Epilithonimonas hominis]|uniref:Transcriptional regulator, AlpA family n=1 Tax=Epilithonimonas hominis TaxID=420404 RepID=A0A1H6HVJ4_9FLAO|nr:helix-turn-helix domain-containing protein [Epilithonimonas hominis]SEH39956.1 transcriptional regulator, AlpA family [Epilithonimonas hominis]
MHNFVLSPIDPKILIDSIAEKVTANILNAVRNEQPTAQPQDELLTIQQASELLNLSVPTLYSKVSKRELPCMKQGKRLYFSQTELLNYIKEGKKKTSAEIEAEADAYLSNNKKGLNNGI